MQYASDAFREELEEHGFNQSMSRKGDCWDNAVAESFFHSLKVEAIYGEDLQTRREMETGVFQYIEGFYNKMRRHSTLGNISPVEYESRYVLPRNGAAEPASPGLLNDPGRRLGPCS